MERHMLSKLRTLTITLMTTLTMTACDAPAIDAEAAMPSSYDASDLALLQERLLADQQEAVAFVEDPGAYLEGYGIDISEAQLNDINALIQTYGEDEDIEELKVGFRNAAEDTGGSLPEWLIELILIIIEKLLKQI